MDMYTPTGSEINNGLNLNVTAVWRYTDSQSVKPTYVEVPSLTNTLNPYILGELNGLPSGVYPYSDTDIYFSFNVMPDPTFPNNATTVSTVSIISDQITFFDSQYQMPERPTLQDVLLGNPLPQSTNALVVSNEWVMLEIRNSDNIEHVFHLHGHSFYVIGYGQLLHRRGRQWSQTLGKTLARRDSIQVPRCTGGAGGTGEEGCTLGFVRLLIQFTHAGTGLAMTFVNGDGLDDVQAAIPNTWW
ncbi:hypothetical protein HDU83_003887 [Entophlyctis luteolus]|nr:hypothetical protein HDU83_003887 [Entophlyctis luteolus]